MGNHEPHFVIADKGYDNDAFLEHVHARGSVPVIPSLAHRTVQRPLLKDVYRRRNLVERFINRIKHYRRIATRYDKTARNYLGFLHLAAILEWTK